MNTQSRYFTDKLLRLTTTVAIALGAIANSASANGSPTWSNTAISAQQGAFSLDYDAVPTSSRLDVVVGLSESVVSGYGYTSLATTVRFGPNGIDARNGSVYSANVPMPYSANAKYHIKMNVDMRSKTYSVFVTAPGKQPIEIARNYGFRTGTTEVTKLTNLARGTLVGSLSISRISVSSVTASPTPNPATGPSATIVSPANGQIVKIGEQIPIRIDAVSALPLNALNVYVNDSMICRLVGTPLPYTCAWKVPSSAGDYKIAVKAADSKPVFFGHSIIVKVPATESVTPAPTPLPSSTPAPTASPTPSATPAPQPSCRRPARCF